MSNEASPVRQEILDAFHMMWDLHPSPVFLVKADRTILAVNDAARALGVPVMEKCFSLDGQSKPCPHCRANFALRDGTASRSLAYSEKRGVFYDGYWTPVAGEQGLYIHYGNDITGCVREELLRPGGQCG